MFPASRALFSHYPARVLGRMSLTTMQEANRLWKALKRGGPTFGCWQMLPGSNVSRAMARTGVDWICVDGEHGNIDDGEMHEAVAAIAACGISPVVRIAANEAWMVKRALDAGAHGILVPLLYTQEDAQRLVSSCKFPPQGTRGFGSPFPMEKFHPSLSSPGYLQQANESLVTIVQIETREALANVDLIAATEGVDVLLVGPFDLGNNIGRPILDGTMHTELVEAIDKIQAAATKHGKQTGIFCTSGEQSRMFADKGFNMVSIAADVLCLQTAMMNTLRVAKGEKGETKLTGPYGR